MAASRKAVSTRLKSEEAAAALRHVDVAHGLQQHAYDELQRLTFRLDEGLHPDLVGNVVRARSRRQSEQQGDEDDPSQSHPVLQILHILGRHFPGGGAMRNRKSVAVFVGLLVLLGCTQALQVFSSQ